MSDIGTENLKIVAGIKNKVNSALKQTASKFGLDPMQSMQKGTKDATIARAVVARDLQLERKNKHLQKAKAETAEEKSKAEKDELTDLWNLRKFNEDLRSEVTSDYEQLEKGNQLDAQNLLQVVQIDAGMLNLYNFVGGHSRGNNYLKAIASLISGKDGGSQSIIDSRFKKFKVYRWGGDEFAVILRGSRESTDAYMEQLEIQVENSSLIPDITIEDPEKGINFSLSQIRRYLIDYGTVTTGEVYKDFRILEEDINRDGTKSGSVARLAGFMSQIADRRSDLMKALKRVPLLKTLLISDPKTFGIIYQFAAKGALGITIKELKGISQEQLEQQVRNFVSRALSKREQFEIMSTEDEFQRGVHIYLKEMFDKVNNG